MNRETFGRAFEDFQVGEIYKHWPGKTVTESDNNLFSLLTMNHHPVHLDQNYAEQMPHGKILVVGTYVFSVGVGMTVADVSGQAIANLEYEYVKHHLPVFIGDTLYSETQVLEKTPSKTKPDRGVIYVETITKNQHGQNVLSFRRRVLVASKSYQRGAS